MTTTCEDVAAVVDELAAGAEVAPGIDAHLAGCPVCQARLALARRIDQALVRWPAPVPPPDFAARVSAAARAASWRQEVVIDWGFNLALAASLLLIAGGAAVFLWLLGAQASTTVSVSTQRPVAEWMGAMRSQALVVTSAAVLFVTAVGGWWWAEERQRW